MIGGYLGHHDPKMVEFKIFSVMRKKFTTIATPYFKRPKFKQLGDLLRSVPWESAFEGFGVLECWSV